MDLRNNEGNLTIWLGVRNSGERVRFLAWAIEWMCCCSLKYGTLGKEQLWEQDEGNELFWVC